MAKKVDGKKSVLLCPCRLLWEPWRKYSKFRRNQGKAGKYGLQLQEIMNEYWKISTNLVEEHPKPSYDSAMKRRSCSRNGPAVFMFGHPEMGFRNHSYVCKLWLSAASHWRLKNKLCGGSVHDHNVTMWSEARLAYTWYTKVVVTKWVLFWLQAKHVNVYLSCPMLLHAATSMNRCLSQALYNISLSCQPFNIRSPED